MTGRIRDFRIWIWPGLFLSFGLMWATPLWGQLAQGDPAIRVVGSDEVNVRTEPRVDAETFVTKIARGTLLKRLDARNGWYQVQLPDGRKVWISGRYAEEVVARDLLEVVKSVVNVHDNPTVAARQVATVKQGDMLSLIRERNGWSEALLSDGKRGWVRNDMVVRRPLSPKTSPASETAPASNPVAQGERKEEPPAKPVDYFRRGRELLAENRDDEAVIAFRKALEDHPDDGAIHFELAKLLQKQGKTEDALVQFRLAQRNGRDEAKFFIQALLKAPEDSTKKGDTIAVAGPAVTPEESRFIWDSATMLLPALALGSGIFLLALGLVFWRRRQSLRPQKSLQRRRKQDAGFDSVLKYAVEKRPLFRAIEEAERKRSELDEALQQRLRIFQGDGEGERPRLPAVASSEALLKKIDDLRKVILNQEERAQIYSDLILLQNEKLSALDEEVDALKKLIRIDYQDGPPKPEEGADKGRG